MGFLGHRCPSRASETHTFESRFCLDQCASVHGRQCVPSSVLVNIENGARNDKHQGEYVSVTALLPSVCERQFKFERTMDYFVEPTHAYYTLRGRLLHYILQNPDFGSMVRDMRDYVNKLFDRGLANREDIPGRWIEMKWRTVEDLLMELAVNLPRTTHIEDWESEVEYVLPLGVINGRAREIRATIDVLRPKMGAIIDWKTISDKGLSVIKRGPKEDNAWQLNCYRVMVERGHPVGVSPSQYHAPKINTLSLFYLTMGNIVGTGTDMVEMTDFLVAKGDAAERYRDPSQWESNMSAEEVESFTDVKLKRGKRHATADPINDYELVEKVKFKATYAVPEVEIMDLDVVEAYMREEAKKRFDAFDRGPAFVPDMCAPDTREWKCNYCPLELKQACDAHNNTVGIKRVEDKKPRFQMITVED